jgi:hypothetical protein
MTTKNLVPRLDGEGKLGVKGASNLKWKEINALSGSFDLGQIDDLQNQDGNDLIVGGTGITITHASGSNGFEYTISASSTGSADKIEEGQAKVETIDTGTNARIEFWADPDDDGTSSKIWEFSEEGHLLPSSNSAYDIGSAELKVRHLYLSDASLRFGASSEETAPYLLSVDTASNKFRISVDNGTNWENIALASEIPSLSGYATETFVSTSINDALQGLDAKEAVDAATTGALTGYNYANNIFTEASATGALTIDGFVLSDGDRVLVKDQGNGNEVQHGIYVVSNIDGASVVTLTRASDITHVDTDADDFDGAFVFVLNGSDHAGRSYVAKPTTSGQTTVGTHGMTWVTFTSSATSDLNSLTDVVATSPESYDALYYDSSTSTWRSGNLNTRSITSFEQNAFAFGNSFYTTHTRDVTASDFDNNVVFMPQGISASSVGTYEFILPDKFATGDSRLKAGQKIRINTRFIDQDNHTIVIKTHDWDPQVTPAGDRDTYIYPVGTGLTATPASPSIVLKRTYGFIEIEVYATSDQTSGLNFFYNRNHSSIEDLKDVDVTSTAPTNGQVLTWNNTDSEWQPTTISSGISNVVEDTSPTLGGNLDISTFDIVSSLGNDIEVAPDGNGKLIVKGNATGGSGALKLNCENNSHGVIIKGPPHSAAANYTLTLPNDDGDANQVLQTDGSGALSWVTPSSGGFTYSAITADPAPGVVDTHYSCDGTFTITLPAVSGTSSGDQIRVKNVGTGTVTIDGASSETIDGSTTFAMDVQWGAITLVSNGSTGWEII